MLIPDPGSWFLPIPDLGSRIQKQQQKREGWKKFVVIPFYVATNFTKLKIISVLKCWRQRIIGLFTQKFVTKLSKYGFGIRDPRSGIRDPGSGKNLFRIPDPGVKKAPDPGSGIRIRSTVFYPLARFSCGFFLTIFWRICPGGFFSSAGRAAIFLLIFSYHGQLVGVRMTW